MYQENKALDDIIIWAKGITAYSNRKEEDIISNLIQPLFKLLEYPETSKHPHYLLNKGLGLQEDAVYFSTSDIMKMGSNTSLFLVEVKGANRILDSAIDQITLYSIIIKPLYIMLTNGKSIKIFKSYTFQELELIVAFDIEELSKKTFVSLFFELFCFETAKQLKEAQVKQHLSIETIQRPILGQSSYLNILQFIHDLGKQLERAQNVYKDLDEQSLRDIFLMGLNANFTVKGLASGETFNKEGKTDLLIRYQNCNVFIAECKIWHGKKYYFEGISQLIEKYLTFRDEDAAIIIFARKPDIFPVLKIIKEETINHTNCISIDEKEKTWFNCRFHLKDSAIQVNIVILVFHLP